MHPDPEVSKFYLFNSTEHEIQIAHKFQNNKNLRNFQDKIYIDKSFILIIIQQDEIHAQLS